MPTSLSKPITIGIDINEANVQNKVGSNQYAFEIINQLYQIDTHNHYLLYSSTSIRSELPKARKNWRYKVIPPAKLWTQWRLPIELIKDRSKLNVFFTPGHYAPRFSPVPTVVAIMDLAYLLFPQFFTKKDQVQLASWTKYSVKQATRVIAISQNTKRDIEKWYKIPSKNITIAYPGFTGLSEKLKAQKNTNRPYILYVGTIQPRKNLVRLIKAFENISLDLDLVIAGKQGWMADEVFQTINNSPKKNQIKLLGFVSEAELPSLYSNSKCVVMPGLYEGFGIPVLEAIHFDTIPVVANTGALPEVVGERGIIFDPYSHQSISQSLVKAVQLQPADKQILIKAYREHCKQFNWKNSAQKILEVLHEVAL